MKLIFHLNYYELIDKSQIFVKLLANNLSINIKLSKTQLSKIIQSGGFLGRLLGPLLKTGLPLMKNVLQPLAKSVLIPLGLTAADAGIHKKFLDQELQTNHIKRY